MTFSNHPHIKLLKISGFGNVSLPLTTRSQYFNELEHVVTDLTFVNNIALKLPKLKRISIYPKEYSVEDANFLSNIFVTGYPLLECVRLLEFAYVRIRFAEDAKSVWLDVMEEYRKIGIRLEDGSEELLCVPENGETSE
jgi:hypothetical protein